MSSGHNPAHHSPAREGKQSNREGISRHRHHGRYDWVQTENDGNGNDHESFEERRGTGHKHAEKAQLLDELFWHVPPSDDTN